MGSTFLDIFRIFKIVHAKDLLLSTILNIFSLSKLLNPNISTMFNL